MDKRVYLIRHAESVYNIAESNLQHNFNKTEEVSDYMKSDDYLKLKFDLAYEDCDITEEGRKQCEECQKKMSNLKIDLIVVSPMRRALQTCNEVFRNHKSNAPIMVDPAFREIFESGCDIGSRLEISMNDFPHMDFSLIEQPHLWYIEELQNNEDVQKIYSQVDKTAQTQLQAVQAKKAMVEYLKEMWELRSKEPQAKARVLPSVQDQKNKLKELLEKYDSIAVVTHSENIKSYIGEKPKNCAIFQYLPDHFQMPHEEIKKVYL